MSSCDRQEVEKTSTKNTGDTETLVHQPSPSGSADDAAGTSNSNKIDAGSACEVCTKVRSKYTCPGCSLRTCSLSCVKEHKVKLNCNGERDKFAFVDMSGYSDRHLLNDYRFLENAERSVYSNKVVPKNKHRSSMYHYAPYTQQSRRSKILTSAAAKRGVRLRIMPGNMTRHKENTSFYTIKSDLIEWHIEWHFAASSCLVKDGRVPETKTLLETVEKFGNAVEFPHLRKSLKPYSHHFQACRYLIQVEGLPANNKRFMELNPKSSVADNLKGLVLIEHPTITVLPPSTDFNSVDFPLLSDDDFASMHKANVTHLTKQHPNFSDSGVLENLLLDQRSCVYQGNDEMERSRKAAQEKRKAKDDDADEDDSDSDDDDVIILEDQEDSNEKVIIDVDALL